MGAGAHLGRGARGQLLRRVLIAGPVPAADHRLRGETLHVCDHPRSRAKTPKDPSLPPSLSSHDPLSDPPPLGRGVVCVCVCAASSLLFPSRPPNFNRPPPFFLFRFLSLSFSLYLPPSPSSVKAGGGLKAFVLNFFCKSRGTSIPHSLHQTPISKKAASPPSLLRCQLLLPGFVPSPCIPPSFSLRGSY